MKIATSRWARLAALVVLAGLVSACGLPRSGPNKREIYAGSVQRQGDAFIVSVNSRVTRATSVVPSYGLTAGFLNAGVIGSDTIRPGDTLGLTVYENVDDGLLVGEGMNSTILDEVQVDAEGFIYVPYAGRIRAAGNSPDRVRTLITERLDTQTPDPQVLVRRLAGDGASVSVAGGVGAPGVFPIERPTRTLGAMLARAGGVVIPTEIAVVTITRGAHTGKVWFQDLYSEPRYDVALRDGDRLLVQEDTRDFTVLGATGTQNRVPFENQTISAIEAIAQVGGLQTNLADPTGVFVFRNEPQEIAQQVLGRTDLIGPQRMVYVLDLTEPNGIFEARDFAIRDDDTLYVTEAPFVQWQKTLAALTGSLGTVDSVASTAAAAGGN
ncbi:polysaccharide biosynthesis/export family protein [Roseicyclus sp. F158]|uniref:Polysaccharide biosynthesis/export family protein n=1 Tax=Tropicimonas omnivorans TaxID=3075590 RepID=A0ABU3DGZ0_9RHOB|nr:polysaccharide biosynthesis/export family protein [Roseicyclus sp. F158]MDT0682844.1 polysaccharide biosynthesis/export family protein [Roseicyclus sp. F158]